MAEYFLNVIILRKWYSKNLGLVKDEYGSVFEFRKSEEPDQKAYSVWSPFPKDTDYFKPSKKEFMVNYRFENIADLVNDLNAEGVNIVDDIETFEYGKFVHILVPEGNKIELWESIDEVFTKTYERKTTK